MNRTNCTLCNNDDIYHYYKVDSYPLLTIATNNTLESDIFITLNFGICKRCKCVQLLNLVDPNLLYSYPNKSHLTNLWNEHHVSFTNFIKNIIDIKNESICEIGGANNNLYNFFKGIKKYTVLDIYEPSVKNPDINYIQGNCESYIDYIESSLILSHTFEHLFNPIVFLNSLYKTNIKHIFISVPNMKTYLTDKLSINIVFAEHTFYFEKEDLIYLFRRIGYEIGSSVDFKGHSIFLHFFKTEMCEQPIMIHDKSIAAEKLLNLHNNKMRLFSIVEITRPTYIMPSHYIGQCLYYYIKNKENVLGFLDNDTNKHNKRLYGTHLVTYPVEHIRTKKSVDVILVKSPYYDEMYSQLVLYNTNVSIYTIEI